MRWLIASDRGVYGEQNQISAGNRHGEVRQARQAYAAAAGAILDRFLHHAKVVRLQGRSYRMQHRRETELRDQDAKPLTGETKTS
ncbi:MAG: ATP-binding protein [Dehalococcoidia bacterium]|nr:ATP-binding protein [Dehalococcoidia bacterium]